MGGQAKVLQDMMAANSVALAYSVSANGAEGWEAFGNGNKSLASTGGASSCRRRGRVAGRHCHP